MKVAVIKEVGYEEAVLGFSLSYNTTTERVEEILPRYAFGIPGENKFLEQIILWVDVTAPRFWWQEADTYRVGTTKQSESTMHTITKRSLTMADFEYPIPESHLELLNKHIAMYKTISRDWKPKYFLENIKNLIPEGFLQRRIWTFSYKTLQNMYVQRIGHRLPQWWFFLTTVTKQIEHPEFITKGTDN